MNPLVLIIPAAVVATGVGLRIRAKAKETTPPGAVKAIPGGSGTVLVPTSIGPGQQVPPVSITQLPPAIQAALNTVGAPPDQSFLNGVAIGIASGDPNFSDPGRIAKARNGLIFDPRATTIITGLKAGDIQTGDTVVFSVGDAGMQVSSIPGGSSVMLAKAPCTDSTVTGIFIDSRVPEGTPVTIPLNSVTGISPA